MKQEMDAAEQALSAIADKSQEAQSLDVAQDAMQNLTDWSATRVSWIRAAMSS